MEVFSKGMDLALTYLGYASRTEREVADYLRGRQMPENVVAAVLARLIEHGYVNDREYAQRYAALRIHKSSRRKIAYELRGKGIESVFITEVTDAVNPEEELAGAVRHAIKSLRGESDAKACSRAYAALTRRGYSGETIRRAVKIAVDKEMSDGEAD